MNLVNSASFLPSSGTASKLPIRPLAPGAIASIFPCANCAGTQFLTSQNAFSQYPVPTQLGDVEVLVNGVAAPLYIVYPGQINFIVPIETSTSGNADLQVIQVSTGQVLGAAQVPMYTVAPGVFSRIPAGKPALTIYCCRHQCC